MVASTTDVTRTPAREQRGGVRVRALARRLPSQPMHVVMLLVAAVGLVRIAGPLSDVDLWWHVRLGEEMLDRHSLTGVATDWSFAPIHTDWVSSEWIGEVVLAAVHGAFGWVGVSWLRVLLAAWLFYRLYRLVVPGRSPLVASLVFTVTATWIGVSVQERPQLVSLLLLTWLARHARDMLRGEDGPRWWAVLGVVAFWANVHGLWVLAPFACAVVALARLADGGPDAPRSARRPVVLALVAVVGGCLTPLGPRSLLLPFTLKGATHAIVEWGPTVLADVTSFGVVLLTVPVLVAWARSGFRVPRSEVVYVLALLAFAMVAFRSLPPALILLAPVYADRLCVSWPRPTIPPRPVERVVLATLGCVVAVAGVVAPVTRLVTGDPLPRETMALDIAARLAHEPGEHRVLNSYNTSGVLLLFGGPRTRLAIDGRADRYGGAYVDRYLRALALGGDWRGLVRELRPTHAVLATDAPLLQMLRVDGWRVVVDDDHGYTLLEPPRSRR